MPKHTKKFLRSKMLLAYLDLCRWIESGGMPLPDGTRILYWQVDKHSGTTAGLERH